MSEQYLDHANIDVLLQEMRGKAVPERVRRYVLVDPGRLRGGMAGAGELTRDNRLKRITSREQPAPPHPVLQLSSRQYQARTKNNRLSWTKCSDHWDKIRFLPRAVEKVPPLREPLAVIYPAHSNCEVGWVNGFRPTDLDR